MKNNMKPHELKKLINESIVPKKEKALIFFHSETCTHCKDAKKFLNEFVKGKKIHYFEIEQIEEWDNGSDLSDLFEVNFYPTVVRINESGYKKYVGTKEIKQIIL